MKAQDFRNLMLFQCFSVVAGIDQVDREALRVRRVWALAAFLMRLYVIPKAEFSFFTDGQVKRIADTFYDAWGKAFGLRSLVYNIHIAASHIKEVCLIDVPGAFNITQLQIRTDDCDSASAKSAYQPEDSYGPMRRDFAPGTDNVCSQIIDGNLLRNSSRRPHTCRKEGMPSFYFTDRKDDRWFYHYYRDDNGTPCYRFFQLTKGKFLYYGDVAGAMNISLT